MPELPEVETVRRGLQPAMVGTRIEAVEARRPDLRFPLPARFVARLEGQMIVSSAEERNTSLRIFRPARSWCMHLGMTGRFLVTEPAGGRSRNPASIYEGVGRAPTPRAGLTTMSSSASPMASGHL